MSFPTNSGTVTLLMNITEQVPANLEDVLRELGSGDNRFRGTSYGRGECDVIVTTEDMVEAAIAGR